MKYKILVALVCIHLLVVFIRSVNTINPEKNLIENITLNVLLNTYTQYTVMQADYAFFSPNVGSSPLLKIKVKTPRDSFYFPFNIRDNEMGIRLFTSLNAFNNSPEARELMARSWAAYALSKQDKAQEITVSYFIKTPPTMQQFAQGKRAVDTLLFEAKYKVNAE